MSKTLILMIWRKKNLFRYIHNLDRYSIMYSWERYHNVLMLGTLSQCTHMNLNIMHSYKLYHNIFMWNISSCSVYSNHVSWLAPKFFSWILCNRFRKARSPFWLLSEMDRAVVGRAAGDLVLQQVKYRTFVKYN